MRYSSFLTVTVELAMLQEDFKITKKIATGGFGTVYRAELDDGKTPGGRPVIIKKVSQTVLVAGFCSFYYRTVSGCHISCTGCVSAMIV